MMDAEFWIGQAIVFGVGGGIGLLVAWWMSRYD